MTDFFRFPHTPHLAWLGPGQPRDDKVLSRAETDALLAADVVVEKKLDGANRHSRYREGPLEGVVIRVEDEHWLQRRAKLVRPDFTQQIDDHWRNRALQWNQLAPADPRGPAWPDQPGPASGTQPWRRSAMASS